MRTGGNTNLFPRSHPIVHRDLTQARIYRSLPFSCQWNVNSQPRYLLGDYSYIETGQSFSVSYHSLNTEEEDIACYSQKWIRTNGAKESARTRQLSRDLLQLNFCTLLTITNPIDERF